MKHTLQIIRKINRRLKELPEEPGVCGTNGVHEFSMKAEELEKLLGWIIK